MSLAHRCRHAFPAAIRQEGDRFFQGERVLDVDVSESEASARVVDAEGDSNDVNLEFMQGEEHIKVSCSCDEFLGSSLCKHIWATLLQLDVEGWQNSLSPSRKLQVVIDQDLTASRGQHPFPPSIAGDPLGMLFRKVQSTRTATPQTRAQPSWRQQLAGIQDIANSDGKNISHQVSKKDREIWFAVNVPASRDRRLLVIELYQRERKRSGAFGKLKRLSLRRSELEQGTGDPEIELLQLLLGPQTQLPQVPAGSYFYHSGAYTVHSNATVVPAMYEAVLARLTATNRLVLQTGSYTEIDLGRPLNWDDNSVWKLNVDVIADEEYKRWQIRGVFVSDASCSIETTEPVLVLRNGLIVFNDKISRFIDTGNFSWLPTLRRARTIDVPYRERKAFLERLWTLPGAATIDLPLNIVEHRVVEPPKGILEVLNLAGNRHQPNLLANISFAYGASRLPYGLAASVFYDPDKGSLVQRNPVVEEQLLSQAIEAGAKLNSMASRTTSKADLEIPHAVLPELTGRLAELGWEVSAEGRALRQAPRVSFRVHSLTNWFELEGDADFGGVRARFPTLLEALRRGRRFIKLDDGTHGVLPEEWLEKYRLVSDMGHQENARLLFSPMQAVLLDALLAGHESVSVDHNFTQVRERIEQASLARRTAPTAFCGTLRHYQEEGLGWLYYLRECGFGGCLADDMGLGKTVQVLALLAEIYQQSTEGSAPFPSLIVVPKSLVFNWLAEIERFTPHFRVLCYTGLGREQYRERFEHYQLIITTYGSVRLDVERLRDYEFEYVILDEAHAIKNADAQVAKAVRCLRSRHRLAISGTPIENHLGELWSLFEFLNPGFLGKSSSFRSAGTGDQSEDYVRTLARGIRPFVLRRTKDRVLKELPEKTESTLYCELAPKERELYDELRNHYQQELLRTVSEQGLNRSKIQVLEALLRLRQAACHPGLLDATLAGQPSTKLELVLNHLSEITAEGHKALVFSQFTSLLGILRRCLDERAVPYAYLDGQTRDRGKCVQRFQTEADCPVFLLSLKAGGIGLNLTAADYVYILDPWWNPAAEVQAVDRAHRLGQERRVFAYRLIARDTVEEKIVALQKHKQALADAIVSADNSLLRRLTVEDLTSLFS